MTPILAAMQNSILVVKSTNGGWVTRIHFKGYYAQTVILIPEIITWSIVEHGTGTLENWWRWPNSG